jgi:hypothetical protein
VLSHVTSTINCTSIFHCVLVLRVRKLRQLLPLYSRRGFCSHGAALGTPVLHYNRCATPAKLPFCKCPVRLQNRKLHTRRNISKLICLIKQNNLRLAAFQTSSRSYKRNLNDCRKIPSEKGFPYMTTSARTS